MNEKNSNDEGRQIGRHNSDIIFCVISNLENEAVRQIRVSKDGSNLLSFCGDKTVRIWDASTGRLIEKHPIKDDWAHFSSDCESFFENRDEDVIFQRNVLTGLVERKHYKLGRLLRTSHHNSHAISLTTDNSIVVWNHKNSTILGKIRFEGEVPDRFALSPRGGILATTVYEKSLRIWHVPSGIQLFEFSDGYGEGAYGSFEGMEFTNDGIYLVYSNGNFKDSDDHFVILREVETGKIVGSFEETSRDYDIYGVCISVSSGNELLAAGGHEGAISVYSLEKGILIRQFEGHTDQVLSVVFSPDGKYLYSGSADSTICKWKIQ